MINDARKIFLEMDIDPVFPQRCEIRRKFIYENPNDEVDVYFLPRSHLRSIVSCALLIKLLFLLEEDSMSTPCLKKNIGFLFNCNKLHSYDDKKS